MRQFFLPLGLLLAVFFAFQLPAGGLFLNDHSGQRILIFIIFLVSGYQTGARGLPLNRKLFVLFSVAAVISLLLAPLLGLLVSSILHYPLHIAMGLIIISSMPPTISSGVVITGVSGGNGGLALFLTIALNLLGIFSMPFVLDLCLKTAGPVDIDQAALLMKMLFFVLLPFIIGKMGRKLRGKASVSPLWSTINSSCIILIVYSSIAASRSAFYSLPLTGYGQILAGVAIVHLLLLLINRQAAKALQLRAAEAKAMIFVTSQKTLSIALAVLATLDFETGNAILVCLIFHFFQLVVDSALASALRKK